MPGGQALANGAKDFSELTLLHPVLTLVISPVPLRQDDKQDCLFQRFTEFGLLMAKHVIL